MATNTDQESKLSFIQLARELMTRAEFRTAFQSVASMVRTALADMDTRFQGLESRIDTKLATVKSGYTPVKGKDYFDGLPGKTPVAGVDFPLPKAGDPGTPADEAAITARVIELVIPQVTTWFQLNLPMLGASVRDGLELLSPEEQIKATAIAGMEEFFKEFLKKNGEYLGSGGQSAITVMQSGALKVQLAQALNFKGAGAPTVSVGPNGVTHLDFAASGGFTTLAATETPDGSTTVFTFSTATAQPSYIVVDNVWMKATTKAGNTNWTWNSGAKTATLSIPPSDDIWAVV